jgi:hypothetical protein
MHKGEVAMQGNGREKRQGGGGIGNLKVLNNI